jgi:hypothetical protein
VERGSPETAYPSVSWESDGTRWNNAERSIRSGGLEVPSSNLGAPTLESPHMAGFSSGVAVAILVP